LSLKKRIVVATILSLIFASVSVGYETREIEPLPPTAFSGIEIPLIPTPSLIPTPTPVPTPSPTPKPTPKATPKPKTIKTTGTVSVIRGARFAKAYAMQRLNATQFDCLNALWRSESGWRWNALNRSSGAYGIPQALPGSKMRTAGADWRTNPITQVRWGLRYINGRYGSPCKAWTFKKARGWY
jgi:hypothetical protein